MPEQKKQLRTMSPMGCLFTEKKTPYSSMGGFENSRGERWGNFEHQQSQPTSTGSTQPKCILVVDDDPTVRRLTAAILKQYGYRVIEADCGWDGLERFAENRNTIELVLSDVVMPNMTGMEMIERIQAVDPSVNVMLMTGYATDSKLSDTVPVLSKPFTRVGLLEAIRSCLESRIAA